MIFMDKNVEMSLLLEIYGNLLTAKQKDAIDLYYNENLSLSEIAEDVAITRQGVRKILMDGEKKLIDFESKLGFLKKKLNNDKIIQDLINETEDVNFKEKLQKLL